jgi:hypothetical protein
MTYITTHITPYSKHYRSFTQDSSTHTPSYVIKAGLGTPNSIRSTYTEQQHQHTGRVRSLQTGGIHKYNEINKRRKQDITKLTIIIYLYVLQTTT